MDYLLVGLAAVAAWFFFFPRTPRRPAGWLLAKPAIVVAVVAAGWLAYTVLGNGPNPGTDAVETASIPHERRSDQTMDYARGDEALRAMLSQ